MKGLLLTEKEFRSVVAGNEVKLRIFTSYKKGEVFFLQEPVCFISQIMFRQYDYERGAIPTCPDASTMPEEYARYFVRVTKKRFFFYYTFELVKK